MPRARLLLTRALLRRRRNSISRPIPKSSSEAVERLRLALEDTLVSLGEADVDPDVSQPAPDGGRERPRRDKSPETSGSEPGDDAQTDEEPEA